MKKLLIIVLSLFLINCFSCKKDGLFNMTHELCSNKWVLTKIEQQSFHNGIFDSIFLVEIPSPESFVFTKKGNVEYKFSQTEMNGKWWFDNSLSVIKTDLNIENSTVKTPDLSFDIVDLSKDKLIIKALDITVHGRDWNPNISSTYDTYHYIRHKYYKPD